MAQPRIRDFVSYLTALPASTMISVCLFLPHTRSCNGTVQTPFESGLWAAILPIVLVGLLPVVWRASSPHQRQGVPELVLAFTLLVMAMVVVTIPFAIWLMWGYSKRTLRGELLVALCSVALVTMWLVGFPLLLVFATWLPAAKLTWGAGFIELVGLVVWASAAAARAELPGADAPAKRSPLSFVLSV